MKLRTYYWNKRTIPKWKLKIRDIFKRDGHNYFTIGNAGDILTKEILKIKYNLDPTNITKDGKRILVIGSISHSVRDGDILCGIGTMGLINKSQKHKNVSIYGLRGPITYDEFKRNGYDVSNIKSLLDPGLLVRYMYNDQKIKPIHGKVIFIPHFEERPFYRHLPKNISIVNIDNHPKEICRQILSSEHVFSSSLHGIIFAHALGRPTTLVQPKSQPLLKFKDYYLSIDTNFPTPIRDFDGNIFSKLNNSPLKVDYKESDFYFPTREELIYKGVLT